MKDLKYLLAWIVPLSVVASLWFQGVWSFGAVMVAFGIVPLLELVLPISTANHSPEEEEARLRKRLFDLLLYANVPLLWGILVLYFNAMVYGDLAPMEVLGCTLSVGIALGSMGINVAHELGHRQQPYETFLAKCLLLPNLYLHFIIEHNRGHHLHVATDKDPASARLDESVYAFYFRSVLGSYASAWRLERERLHRAAKPFVSWANQMLVFQIVQVVYLAALVLLWGWAVLPYSLAVAVLGFLLLETVNYIEHYGLRRRLLASGRYENVQPHHSWNSDHTLGRILLYELTRHSDHHFKATRKYQILRHFEASPQLPLGYPGSMLLALLPPLWFRTMNPRVAEHQQRLAEGQA